MYISKQQLLLVETGNCAQQHVMLHNSTQRLLPSKYPAKWYYFTKYRATNKESRSFYDSSPLFYTFF